ncbi:MAG TPA: LuxR C-terminal-related transcriptional regulator [Ktedonosporobacter sp.]|nr:LuxR C-terminal-related transcriptional regulator [Ktedonosporobacter sp.]
MFLLKMSVALIQQPLLWITTLLWGLLITFTIPLQTLRLWYTRYLPQCLHWQQQHPRAMRLDLLDREDMASGMQDRFLLIAPRIARAFELPFEQMGVRTEEYRQEIEEAITALYRLSTDQEALSTCLLRLLEAAKQNWVGLAAFSPREQEVLELLLQDVTYKEMSSRLHISTSTMKTHIYHIFQKLEVSNRQEAVCLIHQRGWFYRPKQPLQQGEKNSSRCSPALHPGIQ